MIYVRRMPNTPDTDDEVSEFPEELTPTAPDIASTVDPRWRPPVASHSDPIDVRGEYAEEMGEWQRGRR